MLSATVLAGLLAAGRAILVPANAEDGIYRTQVTLNNQEYKSGEPWVTVNPADPSNLVYVATKFQIHHVPVTGTQVPTVATLFSEWAWGSQTMSCSLEVSNDYGKTWSQGLFPVAPYPGCSDPMTASGPADANAPNGYLYVAFDRQGDPFQSNMPVSPTEGDVAVSVSTDRGGTWSPAVGTGTPIDRPMLRVDQATGWVWENSGGSGSCPNCGRVLAYSRDHGKTFSDVNSPITKGQTPPFPLTTGVYQPGQQPFPGAHFAVYDGVVATARPPTAATNSAPAKPATFCTLNMPDPSTGAGTYDCTPIPGTEGNVGGTGLGGPMVSADPTTPGRFAVALANADASAVEVYTVDDVTVAANHAAAGNGGHLSWSRPTEIATPNATDPSGSGGVLSTVGAGKPWFDYNLDPTHGKGGELALMWKAWNSGNTLLNVFAVVSSDNGQTFSSPVQVNDVGFEQEPGTEGPGDDLSLLAFGPGEHGGENLYVAWGDTHYVDDKGQTKYGAVAGWVGRVPLSAFHK